MTFPCSACSCFRFRFLSVVDNTHSELYFGPKICHSQFWKLLLLLENYLKEQYIVYLLETIFSTLIF